MFDGHVEIGEGLCFDTLCGIHDEHDSLDRSETSGHFVLEIHMPRRIDEVYLMTFPLHAYWRELYRDPTLLLYLHGVEHLAVFHFAFFLGSRELEHPICKRGFAVVDMGDDSEVPDRHACILRKTRELQSVSRVRV